MTSLVAGRDGRGEGEEKENREINRLNQAGSTKRKVKRKKTIRIYVPRFLSCFFHGSLPFVAARLPLLFSRSCFLLPSLCVSQFIW